jgi:hypothetical protein
VYGTSSSSCTVRGNNYIRNNSLYGDFGVVYFSLRLWKCDPRIDSNLSTKLGLPSRPYEYYLRSFIHFDSRACGSYFIGSFSNNGASFVRVNDGILVLVYFSIKYAKVIFFVVSFFDLLKYGSFFCINICRFDHVGIYVVMFLEMLQTLIKVFTVFSILIIAFGLAFYILLSGVCFLNY